jgi:hypothetical protein
MKEIIKSLRRPVLILFPILLVAFFLLKQQYIKNSAEPIINPPSLLDDVPFEYYQINADSLISIYTKTGTHIEIPAHSFEDLSGKQAFGNVCVRIREFHTPMEILRAGIPLRTTRRNNQFLESGGMIEIRASKDSSELKIREDKSLGVDIASFRSSDGYNLYNLSDSGAWNLKDNFQNIPNKQKSKTLKSLFSKLKLTKGITSTDLIFELFSDIDISPEMQPWLGQQWKIKSNNITPEVKNALRVNWDSLKVKIWNNGDYLLEFKKVISFYNIDKDDEVRNFSVIARPYNKHTKTNDTTFSLERNNVKLDSIKREIEAEIARAKQEADYLNSFRIKEFGIWNIDKIAKLSDYIPIYSHFDFENELKRENHVRLFCIYEEANAVLEFPLNVKSKSQIYISKTQKTKIVAILPGKYVAIVNPKEIMKIKLSPGFNIDFKTQQISKKDFFNNSY